MLDLLAEYQNGVRKIVGSFHTEVDTQNLKVKMLDSGELCARYLSWFVADACYIQVLSVFLDMTGKTLISNCSTGSTNAWAGCSTCADAAVWKGTLYFI